jgi:hypothetical protein
MSKKPVKKVSSGRIEKREKPSKSSKDAISEKKKSSAASGEQGGDKLKDKLKEYLNKARERRKKQ